jgi:hypothetical protein
MKRLDKATKKKLEFYKTITDSTLDKFNERNFQDLITYCLEELQGCEKMFGLMFIFTEMDNDVSPEDKDMIKFCTILIIGDMMEMDSYFTNSMCDNIIDMFYSFDKLKDGYLVTYDFPEISRYLEMRKKAVEESYN